MKKTGFTLAEVLITLTIIGIVAAMTMPSLLSSIEKGQIGPKLAKAINTLENANRNALQQYDEHSLVTIANKINKDDPQYTYILDTQVAGSVDAANSKIFRTADGINYIMEGSGATSRPSNCTEKDEDGNNIDVCKENSKYSYSHYTLRIDINGDKDPNFGGRDRFRVLVDTKGAVIPSGGNEYAHYRKGNKGSASMTQICNLNDTNSGANCTGVIVDNGYHYEDKLFKNNK